MNTHDHHDDESLPGEDELQALYRSLPRKEPSPALDQAVRQAAVEAVLPKTRRRFAHWPVAAASAAVLVLAAGLGLRMREQSPSMQAPTPAAATIQANSPTETQPPVSATNAPLVPPSASAAPTVAQAPPAEIPRATRRTHESVKSLAKSRAVSSEMADQTFAPPPPQPPPAPAPAIAMAPTPLASAAPPASAGYRAEPAARSMAMRTMAAPMPAVAAPAAAPTVDAAAANPNDTPAQELDKIRMLFAQHRRDEALQRLSAFRQAHPDIGLPDDVRAQLPDHE